MTLEIVRHHDAQDLATATAARIATSVARLQAEYGSASIVLTGGRIAGELMFALADPMTSGAIDWSRLELWWGDERYLEAGHAERNDYLADTRLLMQVDIPAENVHRVFGPDASATVVESASTYAADIESSAATRAREGRPAFDIVLLSVGPDGHVASLFPETASLTSDASTLAIHNSPKPPPVRVSLGYTSLNDCSEVWLLASGEEKADIIDMMMTQGAGFLQVPAVGVKGEDRTLLLIDESAASKLTADIGRRE